MVAERGWSHDGDESRELQRASGGVPEGSRTEQRLDRRVVELRGSLEIAHD